MSASALVLKKNEDYTYHLIYTEKGLSLDSNNKVNLQVQNRIIIATDGGEHDNEGDLTLFMESRDDINHIYKYVTYPVLGKKNIEDANDFVSVVMTIQIDDEHPNGFITSTTLDDKDDLTNTYYVNYKDYDYLETFSENYNLEFNSDGTYKNLDKSTNLTGFDYDNKNLSFIKKNFNDGNEYYCIFFIYDVTGKITTSKLIKIE